MKKYQIIKKNEDFSKILNNGKKIRNNYFSIYFEKSKSNLFGISIPTKTGKANIRNKIKRQIKNIIDTNKKYIQKEYDYVIIVKKSILDLNYQEKEENFINLITKIGAKDGKK